MKTNQMTKAFLFVCVLALCLMGICSAAVSVEDVVSEVGPRVTLRATVTDLQATSYQWYTCDDAQGTNPVAVSGATSASYTTDWLDTAGKTYYKVVVNGTESDVATVTATMPAKPVVFRFDNEADLQYWNPATKALTTYGGKKVFTYTPDVDGYTKFDASVFGDFYIQGYPYVSVSISYPDYAENGSYLNTFDIYVGTERDGNYPGIDTAYTSMMTACGDGYTLHLLNTSTGVYKSYYDGEVVKEGKKQGDGFGSLWVGKLDSVRFDFSNGNAGKPCYIEYIGFFPTEEMALNYSGQMLYDDEAETIFDAVEAAQISMEYGTATDKESVAAYVAQIAEKVIADAKNDVNTTVIHSVTSGEYKPAENSYEEGSYTFTVNLTVGDKPFRRTTAKKEFNVVLKAKEATSVLIPDVAVDLMQSATLTSKLPEGIVAASYQWYTCDDTKGTNPVIIEGATSATYTTPVLENVGSLCYKLVVNGNEEISGVGVVTVKRPTDAKVFTFNNEADLAMWNATAKEIAVIDGKTVFAYTSGNADGYTKFDASPFGDFYVQGYPYVVVSASYPGYTANMLDIYAGTSYDGKAAGIDVAYTSMETAVGDGFITHVLNTSTGMYKSYFNGVVAKEGKMQGDGFGSVWMGKLDYLRIDFANGQDCITKPCYIEYVGFFPTEEMALAYAGAMPNDTATQNVINAIEAAEENGLSVPFCDAENEDAASDGAKALINKIASAVDSSAQILITNEKYLRPAPYGMGTYTFDVSVIVGDKPFQRSIKTTTVTVDLEEKPEAVVMIFDSQEKVKGAGVGELVTENGRSFIRIHKDALADTTAHNEVNYKNFHYQTGNTFNFEDYPYMKISYRRNAPAASGDALLVYAANNSPSYRIDTAYGMTQWGQLIVDMRKAGVENSIAFYADGATVPSSYGTLQYINSKKTWTQSDMTGDAQPLEFRLSRYGWQARTNDYEYIAFFASEDEARIYPQPLPENAEYDVELLSSKSTIAAPAGVVTKAQAEAEVEKHLKSFVFATRYNIDKQNAVFTAPSSKGAGSYAVDVWFGNERKEEYTVTVTVTMEKLAAPTIIYSDAVDVFENTGTSNATLKLENGVIKMTVNNPANDDGFFILPKFPGAAEPFSVNSLPYLKMKFMITGLNKKTDGTPFDPKDAMAQFMFWYSDPDVPAIANVPVVYRAFMPYAGLKDGDWVELIVDTSYVTATDAAKKDMVWIRNVTQGETAYRAVPFAGLRNEDATDASVLRTPKTTYTSIRLNLTRTADLDRYAEVSYVGFFASEDEAKSFDIADANDERFDTAEQKLRALADGETKMKWGKVAREKSSLSDSKATVDENGNMDLNGVQTKTVIATNGFIDWVNEYIGMKGDIDITEYVPSTTENGKYVFDITLENAYQTRVIKNVTAYITKKPDDYIMWRFNNSDMLSKVTIPTVNNIEIDKNLLKFETLYPIDGWGSHMTIDVSDIGTKPFDLENYTYMLMKYRRLGDASPAYFSFTTQEGTEGTVHNVGFGEYPNDWYYTLFDPTVRDVITPWTYNYNLSRDRFEELHHCEFYDPPTAPAYKGNAKSFTINFGMRNYAERGIELEFIAFFPSMEDARNYVENIERFEDAASDTAVEIGNYTSDTVSYYDGNTQAIAEAKAKAIIEDKVSAPVDVTINTVSYTAPAEADGSYVFTATLTLEGKTVYTTQNITLKISKEIDNSPVIYKFTNPEFIKTVDGASDEYDFSGMTLDGRYFELEIGADKPNVVAGVYNTLKLDATFKGGFTAMINGNEEIAYNGDADGAIYLDLGEFAGNIDTLKVQFNNADAKVRALGFFADNAAAEAYDFNSVPAELATVAKSFTATCNYIHKDSKTLSDAKAYTLVYTNNKVKETDVKVADISYANYIPSTETKTGSVEITVTLAYGKETETCYKNVTYTAILAKDEEVIKATPKSIGHEFLGWDTITATKNFASAAKTVEFNIKVAQAQLGTTMNVLENGTANIKLVNGKITVNGTLAANTSLKADTWTHVAVTSDGKIYLDGVLDVSASSVEFTANAPVIGDKLVGHLLDVRFWNDIRTAEEISANKTTRTDSDGLLASWMLTADSYKWLEYFDSSDNNNTATFKSTGWYKMEAGLQGDYSFIHYGDTQSHFAKSPYSYKRIPDVLEWVANNKDTYNIAHFSILGDATQTNTKFEWGVIREAHDFIEGKIPYHIPLGNHDYPNPSHGVGAEVRDSYMFIDAFPYDEYVKSYGPEGDNTFGGTFRDEKDLTNMYSLVTAGGNDYIFFALEYGPRDEVLEWVGDILTQYPERQAIISTHCYFSMDGTLTTANASLQFTDGNEGIDIYNKLVTKYPNVVIVDCGHSQGDDTKQHPHQRGSSYKDSPTADDFGNDVVQMLVDASAYALNYPDGKSYAFGSDIANKVEFGADEGLIVVYMFEDGGRTMHTYVYSPLHDSFFRSVNEQTHTIKEIKTQPALNVVGTELREQTTEQSLGMRFKMTLSKSFASFDDQIEVKGYGVVVVPEDIMEEGMEVTADMLKGTENAKYVKVEECSDTIFYEDESKTDFTVVIHSVPETAYSRQFKARAYVDYTVNGGEVQRLYSFKTLTCSMNSLIND